MSASIVRAWSRRSCFASSLARLVVAPSSQAFALIFCARAIASRKSASASSARPILNCSSPRHVRILGRKIYFLRVRLERVLNCAESVGERAVEGEGLCQNCDIVCDCHPRLVLGPTGQPFTDQRDAFVRVAEVRPALAHAYERHFPEQ